MTRAFVFSLDDGPPIAQLLGAEVVAQDGNAGTIEMAFTLDERFLNPRGTVQGGIVAAMLDDTMGPAFYNASGGTCVPATIDMTVSFIKPVYPGRLVGRGRVVNRGKRIAFLEAELFDAKGELLARATSSARVMELGA